MWTAGFRFGNTEFQPRKSLTITIMNTLWIIIQSIIGFNFILPLLLIIASGFTRKAALKVQNRQLPDYAIIVTAYEQTIMLESVVQSILRLNYKLYHIYVVADKCDPSELIFNHPNVSVLRPPKVLANNVKSHFYAIDNFLRPHDALTIVDSDNLVHKEYLNELNRFFDLGFEAIQGTREPKNLDTSLACLDAARDKYYDFYDGKLLFRLGSSATLSGSGMAFSTNVYKQTLQNVQIEGAGFDKVLQARLLKKNVRIAHAPNAIVYDQKSSQTSQLVSQRSRWINSWFKYVKYGADLSAKGIYKCSWNQFLFGIVLMRPPLFMFLILGLVCGVINLFIVPAVSFLWVILFVLFITTFLVALRAQNTEIEIYRALISTPKFIALQLLSLLHVRSANRRSIATKHSTVNANSTI